MQVPLPLHWVVDVDFDPPGLTAASPRWSLFRLAFAAAVAVACIATWWAARPRPDGPRPAGAPLALSSTPPGATLRVDGEDRGRAPTTVRVAPGRHRVVARFPDHLEASADADVPPAGASLTLELWRREPLATRVRPTFPGATVAGASFLADGRVALDVALPGGDERQVWLFDAATAGLERAGPPEARSGLAVSPDGRRAAYLARSPSKDALPAADRLDEVRLSGFGAPLGDRRWRLAPDDQRLVDLAWAPDGRHLLIVSAVRPYAGMSRTRLIWLDADSGQAHDLVELPSDVVPGSYAWGPDGRAVALLVRSGQLTALCLVDADGGFRYLADVARDDSNPLPFPPVAWSPDGRRLVYATPTEARGAIWLLGGRAALALFRLDRDRPVPARLGAAEGQSPAWRPDGTVLALARPTGDGPLVLREVGPDGATRELVPLPVTPSARYAARWDLAHAQLLVAVRAPAGLGASAPEYWLLRFSPEARP